jgi:hypothetical protein
MDKFPSGDIELPVYPVISITSVKYDDTDNTETTLTADTGGSPLGDYWSNLNGYCPFIRSTDGTWPTTYLNKPNVARVTMEVGHADPSAIHEDLRHAILVKVKEMFDHGGETIDGVSVEESVNTVEYLIAPHRKYNV